MPVIRIDNFGGEMPRASARALPADKARIAFNMYHGGDEFRPMNDDVVVVATAAPGTKTLYRLDRKIDGSLNTDMSTGWIARADDVRYAKGQVNDDMTARTYYSMVGGTAPPRAMDAQGVDKPLGIPAPSAPQVRVIIGDEYTPEEYTGLMKVKVSEIANTIRAHGGIGYIADTLVSAGTTGYINRQVSGEVLVTPGRVTAGVTTTPFVVGGVGSEDAPVAYVNPATKPVSVLPHGSTHVDRGWQIYIYVGEDYTTPYGIFIEKGNSFVAEFGQRYSLDGSEFAFVAPA